MIEKKKKIQLVLQKKHKDKRKKCFGISAE